MVMVVIRSGPAHDDSEKTLFEQFMEKTMVLLGKIDGSLRGWVKLKWYDMILMRHEISENITTYHNEIDFSLNILQLSSSRETQQWQQAAAHAQEEDHLQVMEGIAALTKANLFTVEQVRSLREELANQGEDVRGRLQQIMDLLQQALHTNEQLAEQKDLKKVLLNLTTVTETLPSGVNLKGNGREVKIIDQHAVRNGDNFDIYRGTYLDAVPVALKKIRNIGVMDEKILFRFWRQSMIWRQVWEKDRGAHILQYIGTVGDEGVYPYMVSPWQRNGRIMSWIKANPQCDRLSLIYGIAEGIKVLHTWCPKALIHGAVRGENILISDDEKPLLADFSLTKVLENVGGVEVTNSKALNSYYRWMAPEVVWSNTFTKESDMFAFGMTMLEIMTEDWPFGRALSDSQVLIGMHGPEKLRPNRPPGINDALWGLITECWAQEPKDRPDILTALSRLEEIKKNTLI